MPRIVNETAYPDGRVRAIVEWALEEKEVVDFVRSVTISYNLRGRSQSWCGRWFSSRCHVLIRLARPEQYPARTLVYRRTRTPMPEGPTMYDWQEALAWGLGHELEHARQSQASRPYREVETEWSAFRLWKVWNRSAPALTAGSVPSEAPTGQKEATMATTTKKGLTARQSIEAAFAAGTEKRLKSAEIISRVEGNPKSSIGAGTIRTQLQLQASKKAEGYVKRVAPGTWELQVPKGDKAAASNDGGEVTPDPKPSGRRDRKTEEPVAA